MLVLPPLGGDILRLKMEVAKYTGACVCAVFLSFLQCMLSVFFDTQKGGFQCTMYLCTQEILFSLMYIDGSF